MVVTIEYRMALPFSLEEYSLGQRYMTARQTVEVMKSSSLKESAVPMEEGNFSTLPDVVAKHGKIANRFSLCTHGYYIKKRLYLGSKLPSWIRKIAPESGLYVREEYWNAFPYTFCRYESEFTSRIGMTIESMHFDNDRGMRNHVFGSPQPKHEVVTVDIAAQSVTKKGGGVYQGDPATHKFPLSPGWIETRDPIMGSYKLSSMFFNIPFFPMAERAERAILDISVKDLAIHAHRNLYCWQDDWMWMNANQVRAFESHVLEKTAANDIASICIPVQPEVTKLTTWW